MLLGPQLLAATCQRLRSSRITNYSHLHNAKCPCCLTHLRLVVPLPDPCLRLGALPADIVVQLSGLSALEQLKAPITTLRSGMALLQADIDNATGEYTDRLASGLRAVSRNQDRILAMISTSGARTCADGSVARQCPVNRCVAGQDVDPSGNPVNSLCAAGLRCITDGCNNCEPVCVPQPPAAADITSSLEILSAWLGLLRDSKELQSQADGMKETVPKLTAVLDFLFTQGTSPGRTLVRR